MSNGYGEESVVGSCKGYEARVPAYGDPCSYFRVVRLSDDKEVLYWNSDEWKESDSDDPIIGAMGAMMGVLCAMHDGTFKEQ